MTLERERWRTEIDLRRRELALREREVDLKEREQRNRDAEFELKRREQASSSWRNPLTVAVLAAAVAATGNAVIAVVNGNLQRDLERSKAESERILEMVKTGDREEAAENLDFLVKSGLLSDPKLIARLNRFLDERAPGSGPSLPVVTVRGGVTFERSAALTRPLQQSLQSLLESYLTYFDELGFVRPEQDVTIRIAEQVVGLAQYNFVAGTISIDSRIADDLSIPLREVNHHLLWPGSRPHSGSELEVIESGLADYFACSFLNNPNLGEKAAEALDLDRDYIRTLTKDTAFTALARSAYPQRLYVGAEVWGGLFWEIRTNLGRSVADSLAADAWLQIRGEAAGPLPATAINRSFVETILGLADARGEPTVSSIRETLRDREFPLD